jgi:hypothetical protein
MSELDKKPKSEGKEYLGCDYKDTNRYETNNGHIEQHENGGQ